MVSGVTDPNNESGIQKSSHIVIPTQYQYMTDTTNFICMKIVPSVW